MSDMSNGESRAERLRKQQQRYFRVAVICVVVAVIVAYAVLTTSKLNGSLPNRIGWVHVAFGPLFAYAGLLAIMWWLSRRDMREARRKDAEHKLV
jgi:hypothetical protein